MIFVYYIEKVFKTYDKLNNVVQEKKEAKSVSSAKQGPISKEWPNILNDFKNNGKIMLL